MFFPYTFPYALPLFSILPLIILLDSPELFSFHPQCLVSVQRVSLPAQMAAALPGAGSAMGIMIVPTAQMRYLFFYFLHDWLCFFFDWVYIFGLLNFFPSEWL